MSSLEYHSMDTIAPMKDEYREDESSIESDRLDELGAIRQRLDQITKEVKEIHASLQRMESSWCSIL